uniref:SLPTX10 n=1 Tax=Scolopendra viridis TaxID=118503 RepID=A0A4D5R9N2_SCOVI
MNKEALIVLVILSLLCIVKECKTLTVEELPLPESYKKMVRNNKGDAMAIDILKRNRRACMTNCNLVPACYALSPECCPKPTPVCLKLDIVIAANKA